MSEWQPIETAPELQRIMVCGWLPPNGRTVGYWWYTEGCVIDGMDPENTDALYWTPLVLPEFPTPPEAPK